MTTTKSGQRRLLCATGQSRGDRCFFCEVHDPTNNRIVKPMPNQQRIDAARRRNRVTGPNIRPAVPRPRVRHNNDW